MNLKPVCCEQVMFKIYEKNESVLFFQQLVVSLCFLKKKLFFSTVILFQSPKIVEATRFALFLVEILTGNNATCNAIILSKKTQNVKYCKM